MAFFYTITDVTAKISSISDISPPSQVTNLQVYSTGADFICVEWENPPESDFDSVLVSLNENLVIINDKTYYVFNDLMVGYLPLLISCCLSIRPPFDDA